MEGNGGISTENSPLQFDGGLMEKKVGLDESGNNLQEDIRSAEAQRRKKKRERDQRRQARRRERLFNGLP